jgi:hypothetical protein
MSFGLQASTVREPLEAEKMFRTNQSSADLPTMPMQLSSLTVISSKIMQPVLLRMDICISGDSISTVDAVSEIVIRTCSHLNSGSQRKWNSLMSTSLGKLQLAMPIPLSSHPLVRICQLTKSLPMVEMTIMDIILLVHLQRPQKMMISLSTLRDLITLKFTKSRLESRPHLYAVREMSNFYPIAINIRMFTAASARALSISQVSFISLLKTPNSLISASHVSNRTKTST